MTIDRFSQSVIEEIKCYVYALVDPRDNTVFYVGKGKGNRVFEHARAAITDIKKSDAKLDRIRYILDSDKPVTSIIIKHGMEEHEALLVESALIDFHGLHKNLDRLTNKVRGHDADETGLMDVVEINGRYDPQPANITEPGLIVIINKLYRHGMSEDELYEAARGDWVVGKDRHKVSHVFAVYGGIIRQVYKVDPNSWAPAERKTGETRVGWRFEGSPADDKKHYLSRTVNHLIKPGTQNPVKYVGSLTRSNDSNNEED